MVVFAEIGCIWAKLVAFGQKLFFLGKVVVFRQNWLYLCKLVFFGQIGCICENWYYLDKISCI